MARMLEWSDSLVSDHKHEEGGGNELYGWVIKGWRREIDLVLHLQ